MTQLENQANGQDPDPKSIKRVHFDRFVSDLRQIWKNPDEKMSENIQRGNKIPTCVWKIDGKIQLWNS